jgi:hypothetical protein
LITIDKFHRDGLKEKTHIRAFFHHRKEIGEKLYEMYDRAKSINMTVDICQIKLREHPHRRRYYLPYTFSEFDMFLNSLCTIRCLNLKETNLTDAHIQLLANSLQLNTINILNLNGNSISTAGLIALASSKNLKNLKELDLTLNKIDATGVIAFTNSSWMTQMERLEFWSNQIGPEWGQHAIINVQKLKLKELSFAFNPIGQGGAMKIAGLQCYQLRSLNLMDCKIGDIGALAIIGSIYISNLDTLILDDNNLTDITVQEIAHSSKTQKIKLLSLQSNSFTANAAAILANSAFVSNMETLDLNFNKLDDNALRALIGSPYLTKMKYLDVCHGTYTKPLEEEFGKRFPFGRTTDIC